MLLGMNSEEQEFYDNRRDSISRLTNSVEFQQLSRNWIEFVTPHKWAYNFDWLGRPAIQFPNDAWVLQEIIWELKPDLIIETGIAHGGSLVLSASLLALLEIEDFRELGKFDFTNPKRKVVGIDIEIRGHNFEHIKSHFLSNWIDLIQGSSTDLETFHKVKNLAKNSHKVLVLLDSNHTKDHVLKELELYSTLVSLDSYIVVYDTVLELVSQDLIVDRPWGLKNGPLSAVDSFLSDNSNFAIDHTRAGKSGISVAPSGFLRRIK